MDTDSLYLAILEQNMCDCIRPAMKRQWNSLQSGKCTDEVSTNSTKKISLVFPALSIRSTIDENLGFSKKNSAAQK